MNFKHLVSGAAIYVLATGIPCVSFADAAVAPGTTSAPAAKATPRTTPARKATVPPDAYGRYSYVYSLEAEEDSFYTAYIKGRLHVGVSFTSSAAKETKAPSGTCYLGNLNQMKEEETSGIGFNIQYDLCDYVALAFANDAHLELSAWNQPTAEHPYTSTDGALEIDGMLFQVILQYPFRFDDNNWALTPYVGLGVTEVSTKWSHAPWWHYGWSSPADYAQYGNGSKTPRKGNSRWMVPDDPSSAFTLTVGLSFQMMEHLDVDVFYRTVSVDDVDAKFHRNRPTGHVEREGCFPAEFSTLGLALRYVF